MKKLSSILAVITMIFTAPLAVHSADPTVVHIGGIKIFDHIPFPDGKKFGQDVDFNCSIPLKGNPKKNLRPELWIRD